MQFKIGKMCVALFLLPSGLLFASPLSKIGLIALALMGAHPAAVDSSNITRSLRQNAKPGTLRGATFRSLQDGDLCKLVPEGQSVQLRCPSNQVISNIDFASYGVLKGSCESNLKSGNCHAASSLDEVSERCLDKQSCDFVASNGIFSDPCQGRPKKLGVRYSCQSVNHQQCSLVPEGQAVQLSCPTNQKISNIDFASYGVPVGSCDSNLEPSQCHASSSVAEVSERCLDKQSCSFVASNGIFSDPCHGRPKKLGVRYTCQTVEDQHCSMVPEGNALELSCAPDQIISNIDFASYGLPEGSCDSGLDSGSCHATSSIDEVSERCLDKQSCTISASNRIFSDPCRGQPKKLGVRYTCQGTATDDPIPLDSQELAYYGSNKPDALPPVPSDYTTVDKDLLFWGGLNGLSHQPTTHHGAGKFVFNRIYRASKYGVDFKEQYGIFHWWLASYGINTFEGGVWVNPYVTGPHYYPTLHIAGVGYPTHTCSDLNVGSGLDSSTLGDKWLGMIQISNQILTIPGVNLAFDKDQPSYENDDGIWIGWGWTYLNLDHPSDYKFWMSFVEGYDYQGPINGYIPEYFNFIDPKEIENGRFQQRKETTANFGTFATDGARPNGIIGNEQRSKGVKISDGVYYLPMPKVPSVKNREYLISHVQGITESAMEDYSDALKQEDSFDTLIPSDFLPFRSSYRSTHSHLKVPEKINGEEHLTVILPPYDIDVDTYNGYVDWEDSNAIEQQARYEQNGYQYYEKLESRWQVEENASDHLKNHPHIHNSKMIRPPDNIERVPSARHQYFNYNERDTNHPDFANWDVKGKKRYKVQLQNGSTATYVWFKFNEQPAVKTAQQNWPEVYTDTYLDQLQENIEKLHRRVSQRSSKNPSEPVFINYKNEDNPHLTSPHLAKFDPGQVVTPPPGFQVGYVPVVISVTYPDEYSANPKELVRQPHQRCENADWTDTYFPDVN